MAGVYPNIEIFGIYDRGIPNRERIVLRVNAPTLLSDYFLMLGYTDGETNVIWPFNDNFLWLTDIRLNMPGWIFVYTGKGTPGISTEKVTGQPLQTLYWNKDTVVLDNPNVNPALSSFGLIEIGNRPNQELVETHQLPTPPVPPIPPEPPIPRGLKPNQP